ILERLRAGMGDLAKVIQQAEYDQLKQGEDRQKAPYAALIYDGFTTGDSVGPTGQVQRINHEWMVVCAARSARARGGTIPARDDAGKIAERVLSLLLGLHLGGGSYLRLRDAPGPVYEDGYCYIPLLFTSAATFKGAQ